MGSFAHRLVGPLGPAGNVLEREEELGAAPAWRSSLGTGRPSGNRSNTSDSCNGAKHPAEPGEGASWRGEADGKARARGASVSTTGSCVPPPAPSEPPTPCLAHRRRTQTDRPCHWLPHSLTQSPGGQRDTLRHKPGHVIHLCSPSVMWEAQAHQVLHVPPPMASHPTSPLIYCTPVTPGLFFLSQPPTNPPTPIAISGPLHVLFPLLGTLFPQLFTWLLSSPPSHPHSKNHLPVGPP